MKAASGIIHSEMPKQENGLMRGFQVWINLPAAHKMDNPEYQEYSSAAFPRVETNEYSVKVLIGHFADQASPIQDDTTHVTYLDVELKAEKRFQHALPEINNAVAYVFEGSGQINGQDIARHNLYVAGADDRAIDFTAGGQGARFIVISGQPVNEPIVQHGPFVMNTHEEIEQAVHDYHTNRLVRDRANVQSDHLF
jgi:redox-sensitive bicupin YhaK (pirin superfamily)